MERPDIYVMARFLEALWLKGMGQMRRTELQMAVRLNYDIYTKYLEFLVAKGLVSETEEGGERIIKITQRGVEAFKTLVDLMSQVFENKKP
jgi:predicted transcriptional regulator